MVNLKGSILSSCEEKYFKMCKTKETELKEESNQSSGQTLKGDIGTNFAAF